MVVQITGLSGFIGKNLKSYLTTSNCKIDINGISRKDFVSNLQLVTAKVYAVIHLAGIAHDLRKTTHRNEYFDVNYELTKRLYDSFLKSNAERFIFVSTVKAVVESPYGVLREDTFPNPQTDYGKSKLLAEEYIQNQPLPKGKSYYILRPCMIHGPGNKGNLNLLYQVVKKGVPYPLAGFQNKRSFLSVENLCFIIKELIARDDIKSGVYNVADDEALSTNEVVSILAASLNLKAKLWYISPKLITFFAKVGDMLHLPLTTERLSKLTESYIVSNAKIKAAINKKLPLNAKEGLQRTAASFSKV